MLKKFFFIAVVLAQCVFSAPLKAAESCLINVINPTTYNKILDYLLISRDDVSLYKKIFRAIDAEDFKTADKLVGKLENNIILGHALAEKYLSRGYKASYDELKDWLAKYYDHPQANRIYNLAVRKGGAAGLTKPKKVSEAAFISGWDNKDIEKRTPAEKEYLRRQVAKFRKAMNRGKTKMARLVLEQKRFRMLAPDKYWDDMAATLAMKYFVDNYSSLKVPRVILLVQNDGKKVKELLKAEDPTKDYNFGEITLGTVKSADGKFNNYYRLIKPMNFDASRKYPVIVYVYGGPHSQMVKNTWQAEMRRWEMYMAQHGYVVFVMDNRGTSNQGAEFEKAIHGQCGQAEMADQMEGIKLLKSLPYVDADRIGVHGWSYGGFMTISLLTNHPDVFKVAVAGGPVIDWKWYEVMYGERYMDSPHTNPEGYAKVSLIHKARDLKGKLLICQGAIDNTVVWEHSLSFIRECIKNNIQVDYFPYPCAEHNVMGKDRIHLMQKVTDYFEDYLK